MDSQQYSSAHQAAVLCNTLDSLPSLLQSQVLAE